MLGAIIGDIVGSRFEFNPTNDYNFKLFTPECSFTDDTICTIAVADALLHHKDFGKTIHKWCRRYPNPMGGYGMSFRRWVMSDNPQPYNSFGNGAAMRVSPIAWYELNAIGGMYEAHDATACTHNHPEGIRGAQAVMTAIHDCLELHHLYDHIGKKEIMEHGLKRAIGFGYDINISLNEVQNRFDETCQGTVPVAFWIISESHSFEDAIRRAVSLGADADTLGAIVGSIAEAIWGIPEWIKKKAISYLPQDMRKVLFAFHDACSWHITEKIKQKKAKQADDELQHAKAIMFWKLGWGNPNGVMGLIPPQIPTHTRPATAEDWQIQPMPTEHISEQKIRIPVSSYDMKKIRMGHIPDCQEDHWFMYCDKSHIRIYRSWTGDCSFVAHYSPYRDGFVVDHLTVNHSLAEFGVNGDAPALALFNYLLQAMTHGDAPEAWDNYLHQWQITNQKYKHK